VQTGAINVHRVNQAGKEQVIHLFLPVESFAEAALASAGGYPADARATEPSTVLLVPKTDFLELVRQRPELALRMLGESAPASASWAARRPDLEGHGNAGGKLASESLSQTSA
jgi:CRP-like cAMP-binding protein